MTKPPAKYRKVFEADELIKGILAGDRIMLSKAITYVESTNTQHKEIAEKILEYCLPYSGKSFRVGITGVPGVGKSTFIESFGELITQKGHKLAVLAIDPSSERSHGSILGDKTRMELLSNNENAYIRPSPSSGSLGGVARKTRETIILCEAAGYDWIFIETVGVGQSETAVHSMTDFFLLLMLAGAGDELQGIKRGIMEMADTISITKADSANKDKAKIAASQYKQALHLMPATPSGWIPKVLQCSAIEKTGLDEIYTTLVKFHEEQLAKGYFTQKRSEQNLYWFNSTLQERILEQIFSNPTTKELIRTSQTKVINGELNSFKAAEDIISQIVKFKYMSFQNLLVEQNQGICLVTINRPDKLNALNRVTIEELNRCMAECNTNPAVKVVILTGSGEKSFVAGADISEFASFGKEEGKALAANGQKLLFDFIENMSKPVIAAVNGFALGGGLELAMSCHIRYASENAKMGLPEVTLGVIPGYGGTQRLAQLVGKGKAMEMICSAGMIGAEDAKNSGLVNEVFPLTDLLAKTTELAERIKKNSGTAIAAAIRSVNAGFVDGVNGYQTEINEFGNCFGSTDFIEGTTAFMEKRKPTFTGV